MDQLPRWDFDPLYAGLDAPRFAADSAALVKDLEALEALQSGSLAAAGPTTPPPELGRLLDRAVELLDHASTLAATMTAFLECRVAADSFDAAAAKKLSELEMVNARLRNAATRLRAWLGMVGAALPAALAAGSGPAHRHAFYLTRSAQQAAYLMGAGEEELAEELSLSGAAAWSKLQRTVTSQMTAEIELDGTMQSLPMTAVINLRSHPKEEVRRRGYDVEMREWARVKEPLAASLNGIKGAAVTLARRRGRESPLHQTIDNELIDRPTLDALLGSMKASFPDFRRYFRAKAARMGKASLAWWDVFAPAGAVEKSCTWEETRALITETFASFSPSLESLARKAFANRWIDAGPRSGKTAGAFCEPVPGLKESRILANFDGSLDQVSTIAHELGHAFHNDCAFRAGRTELQRRTPMALAETASIMCEGMVTRELLKRATDPREKLAILETELLNASQVVVDIYSRFLFESEVLERRAAAELSAEELCDIMGRAQAATYGDGLDERYRHPWMWTWKPHYYIATLDFYNFPYAFGLLFSSGLAAVSEARGAAFVQDYEALLASTGESMAADLAARFAIDIRTRAFWDESLARIRVTIDQYCAL
jgi:pepF/M3 family oligoendopeptidase